VTILAALDDSPAAQSVVDTARRIGSLLEAPVAAVHVQEDGSGQRASAIAAAAGVPLHQCHGDVAEALRTQVGERGATVLVIGARRVAAGASPAGHITLEMVQSLDCTTVVVPPDAADRPLRRVLVAVEGDGESRDLRGLFDHLGDLATPEVIALHVIEPSALPPFADSPVLEADAFKQEFGIRSAGTVLEDPSRVRFEMRVGDAAEALSDAARDLDADLIVLAWHRDLSGGHGRMVREALAGARVPLALLPLARRGPLSPGAGPTGSPGFVA
jgi:nucleotide-binding universal stress UspA family protein